MNEARVQEVKLERNSTLVSRSYTAISGNDNVNHLGQLDQKLKREN
jgi:hypothetical protein